MDQHSVFLDLFYYFLASAFFVPVFKYFRLSSVLGYIVAGIVFGPHCLSLLSHEQHIENISEFGIIMLLFVVGLELSPLRIKHLKKSIFSLGASQFFLTTFIFSAIIKWFFNYSMTTSILIACSLSLSSTAFSLIYLKNTDQLTKSYGQGSFGILMFQDLIIVPILAVIPYLSPQMHVEEAINLFSIGKNLLIILSIIPLARLTISPILTWVYNSQNKEIFISSCLLIIIGLSLLMDTVGLSKALGAFLAGIFLSGSELRPEIQKFSIPLKVMMMGVFFTGIGLNLDIPFITNNILAVSFVVISFMFIKFSLIFSIGQLMFKDKVASFKMGLILCQGGEFGVLLLNTADMNSAVSIGGESTTLFLSAITVSIFLAPIVLMIMEKFSYTTEEPINNVVELREHSNRPDCELKAS